ncbi:MAG: hypothetical protein ACR9NN_18555 [Nostochopsis sp.]
MPVSLPPVKAFQQLKQRGRGGRRERFFLVVLMLLFPLLSSQTMPIKKEMQQIFTSEINPDYECIPIESQTPTGEIASPPPGGEAYSGQRLCPDGYVPRLKRKRYLLRGKEIVNSEAEPDKNPSSPVLDEDLHM